MSYDLEPMVAPRLAGGALAAFTWFIESPLTRWMYLPRAIRDAGIPKLREAELSEAPAVMPRLPSCSELGQPVATSGIKPAVIAGAPAIELPGFQFATVADYAEAYRDGRTTPERVAEHLLEVFAELAAADNKILVVYSRDDLLKQARESTKRLHDGDAFGPFDGVPVAVKDELDMVPFPTRVGTRFLGTSPPKYDATVVARMRRAGAMMLGKVSMSQIGIGVSGINPHQGTPRNPYDPNRCTGGSSSGPAASVASGLCPVALGADGGGSIRTPAALCGVHGLKPTFGRVSEHGAAPLCWSVAHVGPLAATARDLAMAYAVIAGPDRRDAHTLFQPAPTVGGMEDLDLSDIVLGVYREWFEDADPDVVEQCNAGLAALVERGATVRDIEIADMDLTRVAHVVTIVTEMFTALEQHYRRARDEFEHSVRINFALAGQLTPSDYVRAQQVRTRAAQILEKLYEDVDVIVTPTTGCTAPVLRPVALAKGESDLATLSKIMRFVFHANLVGLPATSAPTGYDRAGLPVGLHLMGRAWEEALLLRLARVVESAVERRKPKVHFDLLG